MKLVSKDAGIAIAIAIEQLLNYSSIVTIDIAIEPQ